MKEHLNIYWHRVVSSSGQSETSEVIDGCTFGEWNYFSLRSGARGEYFSVAAGEDRSGWTSIENSKSECRASELQVGDVRLDG